MPTMLSGAAPTQNEWGDKTKEIKFIWFIISVVFGIQNAA